MPTKKRSLIIIPSIRIDFYCLPSTFTYITSSNPIIHNGQGLPLPLTEFLNARERDLETSELPNHKEQRTRAWRMSSSAESHSKETRDVSLLAVTRVLYTPKHIKSQMVLTLTYPITPAPIEAEDSCNVSAHPRSQLLLLSSPILIN